jgi:hypothetical protein
MVDSKHPGRIQLVLSKETKSEIVKVAEENGMTVNDVVRFTLNTRFNPTWIDDEKRFYKRLDESLGKKTSRRRSNGKP